MSLKKILIIEDNVKHLDEIKKFIDERVHAGANIETHFASTLEEARKALDAEQFDGIISDVFFPDHEGEPADPIAPPPELDEQKQLEWAEDVSGIKLVREARTRRIPFILCTSTFHHGKKTEPVTKWIRENNADFIVDASSEVGSGEAEHKDWQKAFIELAYLRGLIDHKFLEFTETGEMDRAKFWGNLRENDPDKFNKLLPLLKEVSPGKSLPFGSAQVAASEVVNAIKKDKLHTTNPILMEVLDGPGKGLVSYTAEAPTETELLERAEQQHWFLEGYGGLGVRTYNDEEERPCTEEEIKERTLQAIEQFIAKWNVDRPLLDEVWKEWLRIPREGVEGKETELPQRKFK